MRGVLLFLGFGVALASGCNTPVPGVDSGARDSATDDSGPGTDSGIAPDGATTDAGCATPLTTQANCGTCGHACTSSQVCTMGTCSPIGLSWALPVVSAGSTRLYDGVLRSDGDLVIAGSMLGALSTIGSSSGPPSDFAPPFVSDDGFLIDLHPTSSSATAIWLRTLAGPGVDSFGRLVAESESRVVVAGSYASGASTTAGTLTNAGLSDYVLTGFGPDGAGRWQVNAGGAGNDDDVRTMAADSVGRVHALIGIHGSGSINGGGTITSDGASDIVLAEIASAAGTGSVGHTLRFDSTGDDLAWIAVAPDDTLWMSLTFTGTLMLPTAPTGPGGTMTAVGQDFVLMHIRDDASGYVVASATQFTGPGNQIAEPIAVASDGRIAVMVQTDTPWDPGMGLGMVGMGGGVDTDVLVLDPSAGPVAVHRIESDGSDQGMRVTFDVEGNLYASARVQSATDIRADAARVPRVGTRDAVIASWDVTQALRFLRSYGHAGSLGELTFIAPDPAHHLLYVGGDSTGGMTVEGMTVDAVDGYDGWIARLTY